MAKPAESENALVMRFDGQRLSPTTQYDFEQLQSLLHSSQDVFVTFHQNVNMAQFDLYWVWIGMCFNNQEVMKTKREVSNDVKMECGWTEKIRLKGFEVEIPKTLSPSTYKQAKFNDFFKLARVYMSKKFFGGQDIQYLEAEAKKIIGFDQRSPEYRKAA